MTGTTTDTDPDSTDDDATISRRGVLAALAGAGMGAAGAMGVAQTTDAASGGLGDSANALEGAYLAELRGPIVDAGGPITQLVDIRVAETGATVTAGPNTLIVRYDP